MPGYLLPLEFDGTAVTEFLLVPYVGACIHTPPPPPNQIVHVHAEPGFETEELYMPVWVTGQMSTEGSTENLNYVDGGRGYRRRLHPEGRHDREVRMVAFVPWLRAGG